MSRIITTFETDNKQSLQAIDRLNRELDKLVAQKKKLVEESKGAGDAALKAATKQTQGLTRIQRELLKLAEAEKKRAAAAVKAGDDVAKSAERYTRDLEAQVATFGKGSRALDLYKLQQRGASAETIKHAQALNKQLEALEKARKEKQKAAAADKSQRNTEAEGTAYARRLKAQIDTFGMGGRALDIYKLRQKGVSEETLKHIMALDGQLVGMEKAGTGFRGMFKGAAGQFATMLAGYASVQLAIGAVNKVLRDQIELQDKAKDVQISEAGAQIKLLRNLEEGDRESTLAEVDRISRLTGVDKKTINMVSSEAVSAKGSLSVKESMDAVLQAVRVAPEDQGEATAIAGGLLDVASMTGTADAKKNLGFLLGMQAASRVENLKSISQHLVPSATGVREQGDSAVDAAALGIAFTNVLKDPEGRMSGTGALQLAKQLGDFLPEHDTFKTNQFGRRVRDKRGSGLGSTAERIEFLQQNPLEAEKFLSSASFEAKVDPFARALVTKPDSEVARNYRQMRRTMPSADQAGPLAERMIKSIESQPIQRTAAYERRLKQTEEGVLAENITGAETSVSRGGLWDIQGAAGRPLYYRIRDQLEYFVRTQMAGQDPRKTLIKILKDDQAAVARPHLDQYQSGGEETGRRMQELIKQLEQDAEPKTLAPMAPLPARDLPQIQYVPPSEPARRARRVPITIGPSRQDRRQAFEQPAAGDGASLAPAPFMDRRDSELRPLLERMAIATEKTARLQEQSAGQNPRDRGPLAVARSAVADRNRHVEG